MARQSTRTLNEKLLDSAIRHAHRIESFKAYETRKIVTFLNREVLPELGSQLRARLRKVSYRGNDMNVRSSLELKRMMASVQTILGDGLGTAATTLGMDLEMFAAIEAKWQVNALKSLTPLSIDFLSPSPEVLRSIVSSRPMQGQLMREWFSGLSNRARVSIAREVNFGLAAGEFTEAIIERIVGDGGVSDEVLRNTEAIVRTAAGHVSSHAREETYKENEQYIDSVRFVATLDSRTTAVCRANDGKVFPVNEGPRPPLHWNCRSTLVPVVKSWKDLGIKGLKEPPPATRASMTGQVPAGQTYGEWLSKQSKEFQNEVLGEKRAELFRSGKVSIEQFVDDKGKTLTLDQLREKAGVREPVTVSSAKFKESTILQPPKSDVYGRIEHTEFLGAGSRARNQDAWKASLSKDEKSALYEWRHSKFEGFKRLEEGKYFETRDEFWNEKDEAWVRWEKDGRKLHDALISAASRAPLYNGELFRGIALTSVKQLRSFARPGSTITLPSISSFTPSKNIALKFAKGSSVEQVGLGKRPVAVILRVSNGTGASISAGGMESEVLVQKGVKYVVKKIDERDGVFYVDLIEK